MKTPITDLPQANNGCDSAFPVDGNYAADAIKYGKTGLTKREYFAAKAMQGLCAQDESNDWTYEQTANTAVLQADALLKSLEL